MESLFKTTYSSFREADEAVHAAARATGQSLAVDKKKPNAADPRKVVYRCSKGRKFSSQARSSTHISRRRKTSTQMTGCPFRLAAVRGDVGPWVVRHVEGVNTDQHNHESLDPATYSKYRKYGIMKRRADIINAWNTGTRPHQILMQLRADPNSDLNVVTRHDLNNLLCQHRREELAGRSPIQWLFDQLEGNGEYIYRQKRDDQNRLLNLLIAPRSDLQLLLQHPDVLLCDTTYKTNRVNMPLFNICGTTPTKKPRDGQ